MPLKLIKRKDSPSWWIRGTVRGISVYKSARSDDRETAETIRIVTERQLLEESIFGKRLTVTFRQAAEVYLEAGGSKRFLAPLLQSIGKREIRTMKQIDLDGIARKLHPGATAPTLNRQVYTPFIAVWNHAVVNEWADLKKWKRPSARKGTLQAGTPMRTGTSPVSYERAAIFVSSLPPAPAMIFTALFYTGMRPIELLSLCMKDIDVRGRWIVVRSSKTGEPRGVPMHDLLVPLFDALLKRADMSPQIFRSFKGKPYRVAGNYGGQLSSSIDKARRASGINDISAYTARHTVSTQLVINAVHPHIKDQILGHASDGMSRHYTNVPQAPLIEAINSLPVPEVWRGLWWWRDPLRASRIQSIVSAST
ncbi:tyrosine-type recombinase/integrase [Agrobacterium salinitolerans]|uniref:tyrosine-type recombinase/integrase n=1 Tax=Agrobacterium salinitolerans TaxID=1183413 RepID=UPI0022B820EF|nr:tyrosine-type recombinase/integrase [Agrobacterium salinitolerans]MCZ7887145.1 tyrosine-type recombinase/integrase [Agrobacterium salinitolerans]